MERHNTLTVAAIALVLTAIACAGHKDGDQVLRAADFLLEKAGSSGIERASKVRTFEGDSLFEHINGGAEIYHKYDFIEVATAYYSRNGIEILADLYRFAGADNAYGLYTMLRPENPGVVQLGVHGFASESSLDFVKGEFVVRLTGYDASTETSAAISGLATVIDGLLPGATDRPETFSLFPTDSAIASTEKMHAESFLGQGPLSNVFTQQYRLGSDTLTLFLTQDRSRDKFHQWSGQTAADQTARDVAEHFPYDEGLSFVVDHGYYGKIVVGIRGNLLLGVIGYNDKHGDFLIAWLDSLP